MLLWTMLTETVISDHWGYISFPGHSNRSGSNDGGNWPITKRNGALLENHNKSLDGTRLVPFSGGWLSLEVKPWLSARNSQADRSMRLFVRPSVHTLRISNSLDKAAPSFDLHFDCQTTSSACRKSSFSQLGTGSSPAGCASREPIACSQWNGPPAAAPPLRWVQTDAAQPLGIGSSEPFVVGQRQQRGPGGLVLFV